METLPNIDINIKTGNSLISRFGLDANIKQALKRSKWTIDSYRLAVATYRNAQSKEEERLIAEIKSDFRSEINKNDPKLKRLYKLSGELQTLLTQTSMFESEKEQKAKAKRQAELEKQIEKLDAEIEEIKSNKIYDNAFEWRFEFPEVLNDEGDFMGFDVVIGNPPYGADINNREFIKKIYPKTSYGQLDTYKYFVELGFKVLKLDGYFSFITSDSYLEKEYFKDLRELMVSESKSITNIKLGDDIFEGVNLPTAIFNVLKGQTDNPAFFFDDIASHDRKLIESKFNNLNFKVESPNFSKKFTINHSIISQ